jgi:hypothetical protein
MSKQKLKQYRVKVTEVHTDIVYVDAVSRKQALALAPYEANCEFDFLLDCEIMEEIELNEETV